MLTENEKNLYSAHKKLDDALAQAWSKGDWSKVDYLERKITKVEKELGSNLPLNLWWRE